MKRYSEFSQFNGVLEGLTGLKKLSLPPKKTMGNTKPEFIKQRAQGLQQYLQRILAHPTLKVSLEVKRFVDPATYNRNFSQEAMAGVSMFLRGEPGWSVSEQLPQIGQRLRKRYFLVTPTGTGGGDPKVKKVLAWAPLLPGLRASREGLASALKYLGMIVHPHIMPAHLCKLHESEGGAAVSIRDMVAVRSFPTSFLRFT